MKNIFISILLISSLHVFGQNPDANTEAYLTYGTNFLPYSTEFGDESFTFSGDNFETQWPVNYNKPGFVEVPGGKRSFLTSIGNITVGYNIRKGKHVVGGMFNFERQLMSHKTNVYNTIDFDNPKPPYIVKLLPWSESKIQHYTLAARYHYNWVFKDKLKMYSGVSIGAGIRRAKTIYYEVEDFQDDYPEILEDFLRDKSTDFIYHLHVNAVGLRYGKDWALIVELGVGNRGFVNLGINHHLFASDKWAK